MNKKIQNIVLTALFLAIGIIAPQVFPFPLRNMISPMHFSILICGLMLGWKYGLIVGLITPLISNLFFMMPPYPIAIVMSLEMATYGAIAGLLYKYIHLFKFKIGNLYFALIMAMVLGRLVYISSFAVLFLLGISSFAFATYLNTLFIVGLPGILLQLLIVPAIVRAIEQYQN